MPPKAQVPLPSGKLGIAFQDYNRVPTVTRVDRDSPLATQVKEGYQIVSLELYNGSKSLKKLKSAALYKALQESSEESDRALVLKMTLPRKKILHIYPGDANLMFEDKKKDRCALVGSTPDSYYASEVQVGLIVQSLELLNGDIITSPSTSEVNNLLTRFRRITRILTLVHPNEPVAKRSFKGRFLDQPNEKIPLEHWLEDLKEWFKYYDKDRSNALNKQEVIDGLMDTFEVMPEKQKDIAKYVDSQWTNFDLDHNTTIELDEFCSDFGLGVALRGQIYAELDPPEIPVAVKETHSLEYWYNNLQEWFKFYDKDQSGALSKQEVIDALRDTFASSTDTTNDIPATVDLVWDMFDLNQDATIDENEFGAYGGFGENLQAQLQEDMAKQRDRKEAAPPRKVTGDYTIFAVFYS